MRSLVTLRRLPPAPPDTLIRATATVLSAVPTTLGAGRSALQVFCDSDKPLLAGVANGIASFLLENENDLDGALKAAVRMLESFGHRATPWARVLAHSRIGELCLYLEQAEAARRHFGATLQAVAELGLPSEMLQIRWAMALANLQLGDMDEAERWLEQAAASRPDESPTTFMLELGMRAEILLVRGEVDAGLRLWRRAVERVKNSEIPAYRVEPPSLGPETLETQAVAVVAHAQHGRLDLVEEIIDKLPHEVAVMLENPLVKPPAYYAEFPLCGTVLLALAMVDLDRGKRTGDERATRSGVRLIALAERLRFLRGFQPTMSAARARHAAEQADRPAYADAVSSYAGLGRDDLRAAALAALRAREPT
jgi:tetratricopeptide (TPR) repeat protein